MDNTPILIKNAKIFLEDQVISNGNIYISKGQIKEVTANNEYGEDTQVIDATNLNVIPGFIDSHIHGANGADVMDATEEALDRMASILPKEGTTSFLATTITQSPENIEKALVNAENYDNKAGQAEMVGIHLEGPFVEKSKAGAQPVEYIIKPNIEQFKKWQELSGNKIKTITMAPELDHNGEFIKYLTESGVTVSAGHTNANFAGIMQASIHGVSQLTHLCNAMNGIHHRDIGAVGAAFQLEKLFGEIIADGIHISTEMLQLIYQNMGSKRLILITDAMRAKCLSPGDYELGGQPVIVSADRAVLADGTLAGSILKMDEGAKRMLQLDGVSMENVIEMASVNPAKQIGIFDRKGSIAEGKDADILIVDDHMNIKYTICRGVVSYKGE
ncbi:N-acetylglucosamine-6-phosphate deacetylase [Oceanobacillus sp. 143]|uniref:N-acetylglucosamine-6-phosphate deacetylase n=1 Tax=Oceanobacillus zhaokaii TaxID=2052660 RepID=A0A345PKK9_9BACI|nr:N-acetylglucosamine-6-phosphate deacetylase [Oceanobacillus zhaokaii]AXI10539.1 N-acetylglucosamine-6-phosphate deacetylase [Oceanobacillus zhaokaii]QGS69521.1 N-acetylglucosamine-6-phosphate deacetylase [Oceanobacillus sp. 143]